MEKLKVVVLGASANEEKYSNKALKMLGKHNYDVYPISPKEETIDGIKCYKKLSELPVKPHTLTVYVNKMNSDLMEQEIIQLMPERVIFNPGAENSDLAKKLEEKNIKTVSACTLVLLSTGQF